MQAIEARGWPSLEPMNVSNVTKVRLDCLLLTQMLQPSLVVALTKRHVIKSTELSPGLLSMDRIICYIPLWFIPKRLPVRVLRVGVRRLTR